MKEEEARACLLRSVSQVGTPPADQWQDYAGFFRFRQVHQGASLLRVGQVSERVWFVVSGILRMYYTRADGKEFNKAFVGPQKFAGALESSITKTPSRLTIQSLTDCALLEASYADLTSMYPRHAFWERLGRLSAEALYLRKAHREAALLMDSAADRYEAFLQEWGDHAGSIPNYHIASYLGITPEALSRIRRARTTRR